MDVCVQTLYRYVSDTVYDHFDQMKASAEHLIILMSERKYWYI